MPPLTHLAIIMDGNGRWARARGLDRSAGHKAGTETAREIVRECRKIGIPYLTFYTFSKENWSRPKQEVGFLFTLLKDFLGQELPSLLEQSIRLNVLGDIDELPLGHPPGASSRHEQDGGLHGHEPEPGPQLLGQA
jgi:undecaprenyl diphosphate synthase